MEWVKIVVIFQRKKAFNCLLEHQKHFCVHSRWGNFPWTPSATFTTFSFISYSMVSAWDLCKRITAEVAKGLQYISVSQCRNDRHGNRKIISRELWTNKQEGQWQFIRRGHTHTHETFKGSTINKNELEWNLTKMRSIYVAVIHCSSQNVTKTVKKGNRIYLFIYYLLHFFLGIQENRQIILDNINYELKQILTHF